MSASLGRQEVPAGTAAALAGAASPKTGGPYPADFVARTYLS